MRELVYSLLSTNDAWKVFVAQERLFSWAALGTDKSLNPSPADGMFAFFGVQFNSFELKSNYDITAGTLQLSVHDVPGDYLRIDAALRAARSALRAGIPSPTVRGYCTSAEWQGDTDDFFDQGLGTIYRQASWRVTCRGEAFA